ncbi:MAG: hypothetical protein IIW43_04755 [Selenomonadales bacterium]|nr:hypothetical protein [Selenomonadales bacterium]
MARFLLCHAPFGSGHTVAKEAVEEAIRKDHSESEFLCIDIFSYLPGWITHGIINSYLWILAHCPHLYRRAYRLGNEKRGSSLLLKLVTMIMKKKLLADIRAYQPDIIVCTHATPTMAAGMLAEEGLIDVPVVAVVTDYVVHRAWMHRGVTRYFVAHEGLAERLGAFGFAGRAIVSGIPVRCGFRPREGVRSKRRILVMGGGFGLVALAPILRAVGRMDEPTTLHIIAGSEAKKRKAQQMAKEYPYPIIIEGHSHMVDEAMRQASLLITKAGGVSVAESLAIGVPLILFGSLAGQEEANTEFLVSCGVALTANDEDGLYQNIRAVFGDENGVRSSMLAKQAKLARPDAANDIARELGKMINSR